MSVGRRLPPRADIALAVSLAVLGVVELHLFYAFERTDQPGPLPLHLAVAVASAGVLAWRRSHPLLVAPIALSLLGLETFVVALPNVYVSSVVIVIALYSLAVYAPTWRSAVLPLGVAAVGLVVMGLHDPEDPLGSAVTNVLFAVIVLTAGAVVRNYRAGTESMRTERDLAAAEVHAVAAEERARIARELHDVVAHGMSVVALQAVGGRRVLDSDPDQAREAFDTIERVTSDCLDEMRRLLGILRADETAPLAPQPTLAQTAGLVEQARAAGTDVDVTVTGGPRSLPPGVDLSAYRIVQEAMTNALKHAPGAHVCLRVVYEDTSVVVEVVDDGPGGRSPDGLRGHGLIGMRERVELFGGTLDVGPRGGGGGFGVRARLPLTRVPT